MLTSSPTDAPRVELRAGQNLVMSSIKEGDDVYFECVISANPPVQGLRWLLLVRERERERERGRGRGRGKEKEKEKERERERGREREGEGERGRLNR